MLRSFSETGHPVRWHRLGIIHLLAGLATGSFAYAQEVTTGSSAPAFHSRLRTSMSFLIREDAQKNAAISTANIEAPIAEDAENIVLLEPMIVTGEKKIPEFTAPRETAVAKVLRTGTIMQHVGKKTTVRLWTSGDAGIVLSFKW